jgi:alpha,alpha-trehalose-phosphate synthase [UDP-forming]
MPAARRKLVVVSNRGPLRSQSVSGRRRWVRSAGGLVTALDPMLRGRGGVWVSAEEHDDPVELEIDSPDLGYETASVTLKRSVQEGFYEGVSNAVFWPLLHSFPPPMRLAEAPWASYVAANRSFADATLAHSKAKDLVWVQDYHLMLVPGMLRAKRRAQRIGWFCHVPWPNADMVEILPFRKRILEGLLGADILGFHTPIYVENFLACVSRLTSFAIDRRRGVVKVGAREVQVVSAPIGVPTKEIDALAVSPAVVREAERIREMTNRRTLILGVDRLDYTKGIPERILAWEAFLKQHKNAHEKFVLVQVMVPSRTQVKAYADLKSEIDRLVGNVNGRFSMTGRVPIHYFYRNLAQDTLYAHYLAAEVALVTPLRDGMNLVAHEYVMSRFDDSGVLILSEFAGAATYLKDAISVNPYDVGGIADALTVATTMRPVEKKRRMKKLRAAARSLDVHRWADRYLKRLEGV